MENIVNYTEKDLKRIKQDMRHHVMKNMSYKLLHVLIHFNCLSEFVSEVIHYNMSFRNYNYKGLNLNSRSNNTKFYIVTAFSWYDSLKSRCYWRRIYDKIAEYEFGEMVIYGKEIKTNKVQKLYLFQINWSKM